MLVSEEIVKRWYRTESPVYQNFAYLFDNPLWKKPVPKGFTVCPYFWLSLFSRMVFQPLVFLITHLCQPIIKKFGAPVSRLDKFLRLTLATWFDAPFKDITGGGLLFAFLLSIFSCMCLMLTLVLIGFYFHAINPYPRGRIVFWELLIAGIAALSSLIYSKKKPNGCNPFVYLKIWLCACAIITAVTFHFELHLLFNWFIGALVFIGESLIILVKMIGLFLWLMITYSPFHFIPWWIYIAAPLIFIALLPMAPSYHPAIGGHEPIRRPDYSGRWLNLLTDMVHVGKVVKEAVLSTKDTSLWNSPEKNRALEAAYFIVVYGVIKSTFEPIAQKLKDREVQKFTREVKGDLTNDHSLAGSWTNIKSRLEWDAYNELAFDDLYKVSYESLAEDVIKAFGENYELQHNYRTYLKSFETRSEWKKKLDAMCERSTDFLANLIVEPATKFCKKVGSAGMTTITFGAYLWTIIVAAKKGACPYFRFEDNAKTPTQNTQEKV